MVSECVVDRNLMNGIQWSDVLMNVAEWHLCSHRSINVFGFGCNLIIRRTNEKRMGISNTFERARGGEDSRETQIETVRLESNRHCLHIRYLSLFEVDFVIRISSRSNTAYTIATTARNGHMRQLSPGLISSFGLHSSTKLF